MSVFLIEIIIEENTLLALKIYQPIYILLYTTNLNIRRLEFQAILPQRHISVQTLYVTEKLKIVNISFFMASLRVFQADSGEGGADAFRAGLLTDVACVFVSTAFSMRQENWHATQHGPSLETEGQV